MRTETSVGHYRIVRQLGRGGMGVVYLAHDTKLERQVALKLLAPHLAQDAGIVKRFLAEAKAVANLEHNNIVRLYDAGEVDGQLYFTMEYVPGEDLCDVLAKQGPLSLSKTSAIVAQIASALDYAHQRGIVHRDIKSANVLLTPDGVAKVADFGIARVSGNTGMTGTGAVIGTADYIAPEVWSGQPAVAASDQYALGILTYELLTGKVPFEGDSPITKGFAHVNHPVPKVVLPNGQIDARVATSLAKCLAKRPEDRYPDCRTFSKQLSPPEEKVKPQSRNAFAVVIACVVLASVLFALALMRSASGSAVSARGQVAQRDPLAKAQEAAGKGSAAVEAINSATQDEVASDDYPTKFQKPLADLKDSGESLLGTTAPASRAADARQFVAKGHYYLGVREFSILANRFLRAQRSGDKQIHVAGSAIRKELQLHADRASIEFTQYLTAAKEQGISANVRSEMNTYLNFIENIQVDNQDSVHEFKAELGDETTP